MQNPEKVWQAALAVLKSEMSAPAYETWLAPLSVVSWEDGTLTLAALSEFARDWVVKNYATAIRQAAAALANAPVTLVVDTPAVAGVINNYNLDQAKAPSNNSPQVDRSLQTEKNYKNYKGLRMQVNTDKACLLAQDWGMQPGLLYNLCREYGIALVRECIYRVRDIGPRYFREGEDINRQRGRYCRVTILNEAKKRGLSVAS